MKQIKFQRQSGLTLLEILLTLGILSSVFAGAAGLFDSYSTNMRSTVVGQQTNTFGQAMQAYIKDNYAAVSALSTTTKPALIRVSTLVTAGYLTNGFAVTNSYGQDICGLVLQPVPGQLNAIVVTEGGTAISDLDLGQVAGTIGGAGGGIYSSATTTLRGTMGGWSMPVGNYANANYEGLKCNSAAGAVAMTAGHPVMALWFTGGDTSSGLLYRNTVPGHPELNQMNTDIDMNDKNINNADELNAKTLKTLGIATIGGNTTITGTLDVTGTATAGNLTTAGIATAGKVQVNDVVIEGDACASNGLVAKNATGLLLSCQSGSWKKQSTLNGYSQIDLSEMSTQGPDYVCTSSYNTLRKTYNFSVPNDSLLVAYGYITVSPSTAICLNVDGIICSAASAPSAGGPSSTSATCIQTLAAGDHSFSIVVPITGTVITIKAATAIFPL